MQPDPKTLEPRPTQSLLHATVAQTSHVELRILKPSHPSPSASSPWARELEGSPTGPCGWPQDCVLRMWKTILQTKSGLFGSQTSVGRPQPKDLQIGRSHFFSSNEHPAEASAALCAPTVRSRAITRTTPRWGMLKGKTSKGTTQNDTEQPDFALQRDTRVVSENKPSIGKPTEHDRTSLASRGWFCRSQPVTLLVGQAWR